MISSPYAVFESSDMTTETPVLEHESSKEGIFPLSLDNLPPVDAADKYGKIMVFTPWTGWSLISITATEDYVRGLFSTHWTHTPPTPPTSTNDTLKS